MSNAHTIIGTAGHVDHGKTSLIRALTGIETDRLKEEKKRGITIEIGFAYLTLPDGSRAGIIDVPGHEKFIRNMLSGASSVDLVLLVIAADEGIMPQTREHLDILSLLNIKRGVVALTKADTVEKEWLDMVLEDVRTELKHTFLDSAPIIPVSSVTGEGIPELKQCLFELLSQSEAKAAHIPFRLPVDRVFSSDGFGAVVTGTLIEGNMSVGDAVTIYPSMKSAKVRNLQTHSEKVQTVGAGQRTAVNLSGISHNDLHKGAVLAAPGSMINSSLLDVRLDVLKNANRKLLHGSQLHFHHGTQDLLCKLLLFDRKSVEKGESVYAQIQLSEPLAVKPGDRFVMRFYSPLETVGGGVILDHSIKKYTRRDTKNIDGFAIKEKGSLRERIAQTVLDRSKSFPVLDEIKLLLFENNPQFDTEAAALLKSGGLIMVGDKRVVHKQFFDETGQRCKGILSAYHIKKPLNSGMPKSELWQPLLPRTDVAIAGKMIDLLAQHGVIKFVDGQVANLDFNAVMSGQHRKFSDAIVEELLKAGYSTPSYDEMAQSHEKEKVSFKQAFDALVREGTIVLLTPQILIHKTFLEKARDTFKRLVKAEGVALNEFRDELQTSRKYTIALLDYFDLQNFTVKIGDCRFLK